MNNEQNKMNNEPNKPIEAEELTDKELEGIVGRATMPAERSAKMKEMTRAECSLAVLSKVGAIAQKQGR